MLIWMLAGIAIITCAAVGADLLILRGRSRIVVVDRRPLKVRRVKDAYLLAAGMSGMFALLTISASLERGAYLLLLILAVPFAGIGIWLTWLGLSAVDIVPTESDIRQSRAIISRMIPRASVIGGLIAIQIGLAEARRAIDGHAETILLAVDLSIGPIVLYLLWRAWRVLRSVQASQPG